MVDVPTKTKPIKRSGADWMQYYWQQSGVKPSPLGLKVADILGQVYLGIYHIDSHVLNSKVDWSNPSTISLSVYSELATFDGCDLTFLVLACLSSGIEVSVSGAFKHYTRLTFTRSEDAHSFPKKELWERVSAQNVEAYYKAKSNFKDLWQYSDPYNAAFSLSLSFSFEELVELVAIAHQAKVRISLQGMSPMSLQMQVTQREETGPMSNRHPSLDVAMKDLEPYLVVLEDQ